MMVNDIYGKPYKVKDLDSFKYHIKKFHTINGIPDNSLHEEDGFYFRVDKNFYNKLFEY